MWGHVVDYATGARLHGATEEEWRLTAEKLRSGKGDAYTGAWLDKDHRAVFVDGGPDTQVAMEAREGEKHG